MNPAIVGDINYDGVFGEFFMAEEAEEFAACEVKPFHHREVTGDVNAWDFFAVFGRISSRGVWGS